MFINGQKTSNLRRIKHHAKNSTFKVFDQNFEEC